MYKLLILFLFNLLSFFVSSQILNIDRENGQDSLKKKYRYSLNFSFSSDKQKKTSLIFQTQVNLILLQIKIKL
jgi:hypothetical protein